MATKTPIKAPAKTAKPRTPVRVSASEFKSWSDGIDQDFANFPDAVSAFLSRRVEAPGPPENFDVQSNRAVPEGTETGEPQGSKGTGYGVRFPTSGASTTLGGGADRVQSSRIIILAMGVAGASVIIGGANIPSYQVGSTKVPGNMRAFAGVVVAGTVALVINEISPSLGMLFGVSLIFVAIADAKVFVSLGNAIFGKGAPVSGSSGQPALVPGPGGQLVPNPNHPPAAGSGGSGGGGGSW